MIYQTKGIVLHKTVFADSKAIYHVYTTQEGMRSYMAYTSLKKEKKAQWMKMQPLAVVDLKAERRRCETLDYLKSVELEHVPYMQDFDYLKSAVKMFLNEVLYKILQTAPPDEKLFRFVEKALCDFERHEFLPDFHLRFLWQMTHYLGCAPLRNYAEERPYFHIASAQFSPVKSEVDRGVSVWIMRMLESSFFPSPEEVLPFPMRTAMLEYVLAYYAQHVSASIVHVQSHKVLKEVLR